MAKKPVGIYADSRVPEKKQLCKISDKLWSLGVKHDWVDRCAVCGWSKTLHAHHMVPRTHEGLRYDLNNGIALCPSCHLFSKDVSPHQNAAAWLAWLISHHPTKAEWYIDNRQPSFDGTKNVEYYVGVIRRLKQYVEPLEFDSIVGVRFSAWLEETQEDTDDAES